MIKHVDCTIRQYFAAIAVGGMLLGLGSPPAAAAEMLPDTVHFLIPGGAGGGWDGTARQTGDVLIKLGKLKNASFENMSGGGGGKAIGHLIETAKRQQHTLMVNSTPIIVRSLTKVFPYSFRDLTPIAGTIADYGALVVRPDSELKTFKDAVDAFNKNPRSVKIAGGSVRGDLDHLAVALAFQAAGADPTKVVYVPYDAGGKAMAGFLSKETEMLSTGLGEVIAQHKQGQIRILAITAPERVPGLDVPTLKEQGYDVEFANWRGFFGAPGLSDELADSYAEMFAKMYGTSEWTTTRDRNGWSDQFKPRAEFISFLEGQEKAIGDMMRQLGVLK